MRRTFALLLLLVCADFLVISGALAARDVGIDASHFQGTITAANWTSIHSAGKDFAWAKADEGATNTFNDAQFIANMTNGNNAGVLMGAYHFARPETNSDATLEAAHFLSVVQPNGPSGSPNYLAAGFMRPVVDMETDGVATTAGRAYLSGWANSFINYVVAHGGGSGVAPLIYCNSNYASNYFDSSVSSRDLWIANYLSGTNPPAPTGNPPAGTGVWSNWAFWQYSSSGAVSGISGNVDLDVANGDNNFVRTFLNHPVPEPNLIPTLAVIGMAHLAAKRRGR
jgi:GH25 family lysozyme M1 (1,4-beta-N-acetylmuramidase)